MVGRPRTWHDPMVIVATVKLPYGLVDSFRSCPPAGQSLSSFISDLAIRALGEDPLEYREPLPGEAIPDHVLVRREAAETERLVQEHTLRTKKMADSVNSIYMTLWNRGASDKEFLGLGLKPPSYLDWPSDRETLLLHRLNETRRKAGLDLLPNLPNKPTHPEIPMPGVRQVAVSKANPEQADNLPTRTV